MKDRFLYIGFSYPKKFKIGAYLIAWWTNVPYSHVYIRFESSDMRIPSNVYHASHGMVHFKTHNNVLLDNNSVKEYKLPITSDDRVEILAHCMTLAGEKYGTCELAKIFISDIAHSLFNKVIRWKNSKGYICSELVGNICQKHFNIKFDRPLFLLKPNHIDLALAQAKYEIK